jgi:hypothetical protein
MGITYRSIVPENNKDTYVEYDVVDFIVSFPTEKLNLNSLRIEGELQVFSDAAATTPLVAQNIQMDKLVGAHSLFAHVQTFISGESTDNIIEYPRMVKSIVSASASANDMNNASNACELKMCDDVLARKALRREIPVNQYSNAPYANGLFKDVDFSIKPLISLNRVTTDNKQVKYSQVGDIRISVQLARNEAVFFGIGNTANVNYKIANLRLVCSTYPDILDEPPQPVVMRKTVSVQQSFIGQVAQINMNAPIEADRCFGTIIRQDDQNQVVPNNLALQKPTEPKSVKFLWNSATNEYISYELRSEPEIIDNYLNAISFVGKNSTSLKNIASNDGWGIGLRMGDMIDMMTNKLTVVLESNVISNTTYILTMFFDGVTKL